MVEAWLYPARQTRAARFAPLVLGLRLSPPLSPPWAVGSRGLWVVVAVAQVVLLMYLVLRHCGVAIRVVG